MNTELYIAIFAGFVSVVSVMLTVYDKVASMAKKWRIPEKMLMLFGFFGGAMAMYATMQLIRHKTKHKKFMIGLPVFILLHLALILFLVYSK